MTNEMKDLHDWYMPHQVAYPICRICGVVKRRDGKNTPCKGPTRLRQMEGEAERAETQLVRLERDLRASLRGGYLFGNFDEPFDMAGKRIVRVIQQRLLDLPCECTDPTPEGARCRACGGRVVECNDD